MSSLDIFNKRITSETLLNKAPDQDITNCPKSEYMQGEFYNTATPESIYMVKDGSNNPMAGNLVSENGKRNTNLPECDDEFKNNGSGCCVLKSNGKNSCNPHSSYMGYNYIFEDGSYNVCHKNSKVQNLFSTFFDEPNNIKRFFILIILFVFILFVTACIGSCYEFWLRYGASPDCIYYQSKMCDNMGKMGNPPRTSIIDYMFPNSILHYPYEKCKSSMSQEGGNKKTNKSMKGGNFVSTYAERANEGLPKCITLDDDVQESDSKPFPYNIGQYANDNITSPILAMPVKAFSNFFLFTVLLTRFILHYIFKKSSQGYQRTIKNNAIASNIVFLILSGLLFTIIGRFIPIRILGLGPFAIIGLLLMFLITTTLNPGFSSAFSMLISIPFIFKYTPLNTTIENNKQYNIPSNYYTLFSSNLLYPLNTSFNTTMGPFQEGRRSPTYAMFFNIMRNLGLLFFIIPFFVIFAYIFGILGCILACIYMNFSLLFNMFYIPMSNPLEFFDILKSHSSLLTILLCIAVIGASSSSFNSTTTGIMGGILALLILFKLYSRG